MQVMTLLTKMERLNGERMNPAIHTAVEQWADTIRVVHIQRKDDMTHGGPCRTAGLTNAEQRLQEDRGGVIINYFLCCSIDIIV